MWQRHNVQLANFDVASLRVIWFRWGSLLGAGTSFTNMWQCGIQFIPWMRA